MEEEINPRMAKALSRYEVIASYIANPPRRGVRAAYRKQLADKVWTGPGGEPFKVSAETIRVWIRRYRQRGLEGLMDKQRPRRRRALSDDVIDKACKLKEEVPERTLDRIICVLEGLNMAPIGMVKRSTLHRVLQARGLSRAPVVPDNEDLDRFEALAPNDLWQSDMLTGPWLPDPENPEKMRRTWLYAFLDDHSRLLLAGRFSFKGHLPALELVFRRALQQYGICRRVYYDNGQVYRSGHMKQIVATLGMQRIIHTQSYRPMGHGKIEAWNRLAKRQFIAEVAASKIQTLTELNEAFLAWVTEEYNTRVHGETGQTPLERWRAGIEDIRYADEEALRLAFLWTERRKADKSGIISLHGVKYQVGPELAGRYVDLRYDPEDMLEIEVHRDGRLQERLRPFEVEPWRRPQRAVQDTQNVTSEPLGDWLGHLVRQRREKGALPQPDPKVWKAEAKIRRQIANDAVITLLRDRLDEGVVDEAEIRAWLAQFGPLDAERVELELDVIVNQVGAGLHSRFYLQHLREVLS